MRYSWENRQAEPALLVSIVKSFFTSKGFREIGSSEKSKHGHILLFAAPYEGVIHNVKVGIRSFDHGFEIDFESGEDLGTLGKISSFTTMFGGGVFVRGKLLKADPRFIERIENEFWDYVETRVEKPGS